jgi:PqqD family protein of HPr-rel-A system
MGIQQGDPLRCTCSGPILSRVDHQDQIVSLAPHTAFSWRRWGDEWVAFEAYSGQTNLMGSVSALALMELESGPLRLPELESRIADNLELSEVPEFPQMLAGAIAELSGLGLVAACPHEVV